MQRSNDPRVIGYGHRLNWYQVPPPFEITLEEFETFALDRLHVLKAIETAQVRNIKKDEELKQFLKETVKKYLPLSFNTARANNVEEHRQKLFNERKKDHIGHFILRLAFCRTEDLRNWMLKMETELFRLRLLDETQDSKDKFLKQINLSISLVNLAQPTTTSSKQEHESLVKELCYLHQLNAQDLKNINFFKVEFHKVLDLVMKRQVVVRNGFAYVPSSMQTALIVNEFREMLLKGLEETAKALPRLDDDRLTPILSSISKQNVSSSKNSGYLGTDGSKITHAQVDELANKHFPLCMKALHLHVRQEAHLKHGGRLQYGLFLKGIGLDMEEALTFWRKAFHRMSDDQFQKGGYAYNIRHNYGFEGKRTNYAPYNCVKVIASNHPNAGEHHGCPFRHYSQDNLRTLLTSSLSGSNVGNSVNEVMKLVTDGHYQIACTRVYELTHKTSSDQQMETIEHPNQYFELSYKGFSKRNPKTAKTDEFEFTSEMVSSIDSIIKAVE